jgi:hypothetical protein
VREPVVTPLQQRIRELSDRIVEAQRSIRILDAVKWDDSVEQAFLAGGANALPPVDEAYYAARPLPFRPDDKRREFADLEREIQRQIGEFNPIGGMMRRMCREYRTVIDMLAARGTPEFARLSVELYGSAHDAFSAGEPTLFDFGTMLSGALANIERESAHVEEERTIPAEEAVQILQHRLAATFRSVPRNGQPAGRVKSPGSPDSSRLQDPAPREEVAATGPLSAASSESPFRIMLSDGIVADAAAGSDYIKLRQDARFNERDLRLLEVHEGWVHLGTTLNGLTQPICTFLGKGAPSATITQEGLAVLMETIAMASFPARLLRLTNRIRGIAMAEDGADFLDVYRALREHGYSERDSYQGAARVFRGSTPQGKPFTKDICYTKGFVLTYNFVSLAVQKGMLERIPLLFVGKAKLEDMRTLHHAIEDGLVVPPRYLPPPFADLNALSAWICYSNFLRRIDLRRIEVDYANIF